MCSHDQCRRHCPGSHKAELESRNQANFDKGLTRTVNRLTKVNHSPQSENQSTGTKYLCVPGKDVSRAPLGWQISSLP